MMHILIIRNGGVKVAQRATWNGEPEYNAEILLDFLKTNSIDDLHEIASKAKFVNYFRRIRLSKLIQQGDFDKIRLIKSKYPYIGPWCGVSILHALKGHDGPIYLMNNHQFLRDHIYCTWGYVIDLTDQSLSIYSFGRFKQAYSLQGLPSMEQFIADIRK